MASFPRVPSAPADVGIVVPGGGPFGSNPSHSVAGDRGTGKVWKVVKTPLTVRFRVGYQSQRAPVVTTQNQKEGKAQAWAPEQELIRCRLE